MVSGWVRTLLGRLEGDRGIWLCILLLSAISILAVYSSTSALALRFRDGHAEYYLSKHLVLMLIAWVVMFFVHKFDYRVFARFGYLLLFITIILLAYTLSQGEKAEIHEANRWISLLGQSFQPSDLAKLSLMIFLARILTEKQEIIKDFRKGFLPIIFWVCVICGLIAPANLSTAVLIFSTSLLIMYVAGVTARHIIGLLFIGIIGITILMFTAKRGKTWQNRLYDYTERYINPEYEPNYQTQQANIAIVSGGVIGKGIGKSQQRNFLPHPYSDFVFAIIVEEYGMVLGGGGLLLLYLTILIRSVAIVTVSKTFGALLAAGLSFLIVIQALVNMGVAVGLLPVTGLQLPMVSMGGTSLIFTGVSFGIILSVSRRAIQDRQEVPNATLAGA